MKLQTRQFAASFAIILIVGTLGSNAAGQTPNRTDVNPITLGIVSQINQKEIEEHFRDFVNYVARKLSPESKVEGKIIIARTVAELAKLLEQQKVDFYIESPYSTYVINNVHGAAKLLLRRWKGGMAEYQSLIFARRNSGISRLQDLPGKMIVFEDPESTSGHFLPKLFLQRSRFKLSEKSRLDATISPQEIGYIFARFQNPVELVLTNQAAAGAFSDDDYARLDDQRKSQINILAQTEKLPRHLLSVRNDLTAAVTDRLQQVLLSMHEDKEGRRILQDTDDTTKFDILPEGEQGMRRRLLETFYAPDKR
jgi:phosphonate transport system substrate-binding protein